MTISTFRALMHSPRRLAELYISQRRQPFRSAWLDACLLYTLCRPIDPPFAPNESTVVVVVPGQTPTFLSCAHVSPSPFYFALAPATVLRSNGRLAMLVSLPRFLRGEPQSATILRTELQFYFDRASPVDQASGCCIAAMSEVSHVSWSNLDKFWDTAVRVCTMSYVLRKAERTVCNEDESSLLAREVKEEKVTQVARTLLREEGVDIDTPLAAVVDSDTRPAPAVFEGYSVHPSCTVYYPPDPLPLTCNCPRRRSHDRLRCGARQARRIADRLEGQPLFPVAMVQGQLLRFAAGNITCVVSDPPLELAWLDEFDKKAALQAARTARKHSTRTAQRARKDLPTLDPRCYIIPGRLRRAASAVFVSELPVSRRAGGVEQFLIDKGQKVLEHLAGRVPAAAAAAAAASGVQSFAAAVAAAVAAVGLMPQSAVLRASDAPKIMQCCSYFILYYL